MAILTVDIIQRIIGRTGRRHPEYGGLLDAYTQGLQASYYIPEYIRVHIPKADRAIRHHMEDIVSEKTIREYCNGTHRIPHWIIQHYAGDAGHRRVLDDMLGLTRTCTSLHRLRVIQAEVHTYLATALPPDVAVQVERHYTPTGATRDQIALYLADALYYGYCQ